MAYPFFSVWFERKKMTLIISTEVKTHDRIKTQQKKFLYFHYDEKSLTLKNDKE